MRLDPDVAQKLYRAASKFDGRVPFDQITRQHRSDLTAALNEAAFCDDQRRSLVRSHIPRGQTEERALEFLGKFMVWDRGWAVWRTKRGATEFSEAMVMDALRGVFG